MAGTASDITKAECLAYDHRLHADVFYTLCRLLAWFYLGTVAFPLKPRITKLINIFLEYHSQVGLFRVVLGNKQKSSLSRNHFSFFLFLSSCLTVTIKLGTFLCLRPIPFVDHACVVMKR